MRNQSIPGRGTMAATILPMVCAPVASAHGEIAFVFDRAAPWMNRDCYLLDLGNSLRRVTNGSAVGSNPIQLSTGALFSHDDASILYLSTRTLAGNSQIFSVPAGSIDVPISSATQHTSHAGSDDVLEPVSNNSFIVTSDLGLAVICGEADGEIKGPTADLDLVKVTPALPVPRLNPTDTDTSQECLQEHQPLVLNQIQTVIRNEHKTNE